MQYPIALTNTNASAKSSLRLGKAYLVRLQFNGSSIQMWVDGVLGPVVSDTSITTGCIGLFTMGTQAGFDNVAVY